MSMAGDKRTFRLAPFPCPHCGQNVIVDKGQISDEGDHIAMTVGKALNYDAIFGDVVARKDAEWHEMRDYAVGLRDTLDQHRTLLTAAHALLTIRLRGQLDTPDGLRAWNDLLAAHDALAEQTTETRTMHEMELVVDMPNMELLVDTPNPAMLDATLQQLGAVLVGGPDDYVTIDGHYVVRALGDVGFIKYACETQGYATVIDGPGNWTMP